MSWDPTTGQRKLAFACVVVALAGAGVYFTLPAFRTSNEPSPSSSPASAETAGGRMANGPAAVGPTTSTTAAPSQPAADIGALLPLDADELAEATETARRFTAAYATYRYDEEPEAYRRRLEPFVTDPIASEIADGARAAPAGRETLAREKVVVTAVASVEKTRLISAESVVTLVRADQTVTSTKGTTSEDERFAVTVVDRDGRWKVSNIAPAGAGNAGDVS